MVIAELFGKISSSGSNLTDRLEDNLTGDVFGVLRYLPFHSGMAQILSAARIDGLSKSASQSTLTFGVTASASGPTMSRVSWMPFWNSMMPL